MTPPRSPHGSPSPAQRSPTTNPGPTKHRPGCSHAISAGSGSSSPNCATKATPVFGTRFWWISIHWFQAGYPALGWIGFACAASGAAVLIFLAPFPRPLRYLIAFSFYFLYQYAVVSRSYNLLPLLAFLAAWFYRRGTKAPAIPLYSDPGPSGQRERSRSGDRKSRWPSASDGAGFGLVASWLVFSATLLFLA